MPREEATWITVSVEVGVTVLSRSSEVNAGQVDGATATKGDLHSILKDFFYFSYFFLQKS